MKFDPKADFTQRQELLRICLDRGISQKKMVEITHPMKGLSQEEKEQMAAELIPVVESGVYDCYPRRFYHKTEWYDDINRLYDTGNISYDTVRSLVEKILRYCKISTDVTENIFSLLRTENSLRQMYNWLMGQRYVPDETACMNKAHEISDTP